MSKHFDLQRFVSAQQDGVYQRTCEELRNGRKTSHWMWFVFPQIAGLARSATARYFAISSIDEARAFLEHPILGPRLRQSSEILLDIRSGDAVEVFGEVDAQKLRSSMTLFQRSRPDEPIFQRVLDRYFAGIGDEATDALLASAAGRAASIG